KTNWISRSGSILFKAFQATSRTFCTCTSSSTTTMHLLNIAWPRPQMACITLRAWPGIRFPDRHQDQVVENAFRRHRGGADIGKRQPPGAQKNALDTLAAVG